MRIADFLLLDGKIFRRQKPFAYRQLLSRWRLRCPFRAIGRHASKHIPGSPSILVENMAGAGSMIAANYVYNQAKRMV
jgi:hypothetical protein